MMGRLAGSSKASFASWRQCLILNLGRRAAAGPRAVRSTPVRIQVRWPALSVAADTPARATTRSGAAPQSLRQAARLRAGQATARTTAAARHGPRPRLTASRPSLSLSGVSHKHKHAHVQGVGVGGSRVRPSGSRVCVCLVGLPGHAHRSPSERREPASARRPPTSTGASHQLSTRTWCQVSWF